jgi:GntR family transcriptional regulator
MPNLHRSAGAPLWQQLAAELRGRLERGEFAGGLPGELGLVREYGVSRHTVREALRQLRADGVITTSRGRRTRVAEPVIAQATGIAYSLFGAVESRGLTQRSLVRAQDVRADGVVAARLGLEESTPLFHLERLRLADGEPLALDRVWLPATLAEPLLTVDFGHTALYDQLLTTTGVRVTGGQETVRAVVPSPAEHETLGLTPPAAAFFVERSATADGVVIEWRQTLIRADRFALTTALGGAPGTEQSPGASAPLSLVPRFPAGAAR